MTDVTQRVRALKPGMDNPPCAGHVPGNKLPVSEAASPLIVQGTKDKP